MDVHNSRCAPKAGAKRQPKGMSAATASGYISEDGRSILDGSWRSREGSAYESSASPRYRCPWSQPEACRCAYQLLLVGAGGKAIGDGWSGQSPAGSP